MHLKNEKIKLNYKQTQEKVCFPEFLSDFVFHLRNHLEFGPYGIFQHISGVFI